jgi:hypothetical protein
MFGVEEVESMRDPGRPWLFLAIVCGLGFVGFAIYAKLNPVDSDPFRNPAFAVSVAFLVGLLLASASLRSLAAVRRQLEAVERRLAGLEADKRLGNRTGQETRTEPRAAEDGGGTTVFPGS